MAAERIDDHKPVIEAAPITAPQLISSQRAFQRNQHEGE